MMLLADAAEVPVVLRLHELLARLPALAHQLLRRQTAASAACKILPREVLMNMGRKETVRPRSGLRGPGTCRARGGSRRRRGLRARRCTRRSGRCGRAWSGAWAPRRRSSPAPRPPSPPRPRGTGARRSCSASTCRLIDLSAQARRPMLLLERTGGVYCFVRPRPRSLAVVLIARAVPVVEEEAESAVLLCRARRWLAPAARCL